jgi:diguanylate cyclase (GGDEF)-like protein
MTEADKRQTILVVDDVPTNIDILVGLLNDKYRVKAARNGRKALDIARSANPPDLILMDVVMPEMDGYEACKRLKDEPDTAAIPLIFVTSLNDDEDEEKGLRMGAVDYITKPFRSAIVLARVENHLKLKSYQDLLKRQSNLDGLTGLPNRRAFDELIDQEWRRGARLESPLSLVMLDIDCFKQYNDTYGHIPGDEVLRKVGKALASVGRSIDFVGRYGGEEFVCLLPHTDTTGARNVAAKLQDVVGELQIPHEQSKAAETVSISLGVACIVPEAGADPTGLIEKADAMLYQAKEKGRNRFQCATDGWRLPTNGSS